VNFSERPTAAIDFGASNTDVVVADGDTYRRWTLRSEGQPDDDRVRAVLAAGELTPSALRWLAVTGGNRERLSAQLEGCVVRHVPEVAAIGRGGLAVAQLDEAIVASAGSGTAVVHATMTGSRHFTGSGVGGGTLVGLGRMLAGESSPRELDRLARSGDHRAVNLTIGEVLGGAIGTLPPDTTAVNFGRAARGPVEASPADLAAALVNMVGQVIGIIAINAARAVQTSNIVVVGHLTDLESVRDVLHKVAEFYSSAITIPEHAGYATATGALLEAS
jgi:type II pantothenate kinase